MTQVTRGCLVALLVCAWSGFAAAQPVQLLHRFTSSPAYPNGPLLQVPDGSFYGVTLHGIIRLSPAGDVTDVARVDDGTPSGGLVRASDGALYGTTTNGGPAGRGTVFRFDPATADVRTVHAFTSPAEGTNPLGGLVQLGGSLYGVTQFGPGTSVGMVFHVVVATGVVVTDGPFPSPAGPLVVGPDGLLYGASTVGGSIGALYRFDPADGTVTTAHAFFGPDGSLPKTLTLGSDGSLYGNAVTGGLEGVGTLFRYTPATDRFERLYSLTPSNGLDGLAPGPLVQGVDGHFYGITDRQDAIDETAAGSVFRLRAGAGGTFTYETLHVLDAPSEGHPQQSRLTQGADGLIYGYANARGPTQTGTLFRFDPLAGGPPSNPIVFTVLHTFPLSTTWGPSAPVLAADGFLYGLTTHGAASNRGAVYRLAPATGAVTILGALPGAFSAAVTNSALVRGPDALLYGTSTTHVPSPSTAIIRVDPASGSATVAVAAIGPPPSPASPGPVNVAPGLTRTPAGLMYGVGFGGSGGFVFRFDPVANAVFEVARIGSDTVPFSPLVAASDGRVWMAVQIWFGPAFAAQKRPALLRLDASSPSGFTELPLSGPVVEPTGLVQGTDGHLYVAGASAGPIVVRADTTTGVMTTVCTLPPAIAGGPAGLSAGADGAIYGFLGGGRQLFRCDPATGHATLRTLPGDVGRVSGPLVPLGPLLLGASSDPAILSQERFGGVLFRLAAAGALPALDSDGDTLPSEWETAYGLDPFDGGHGSGPSDDPDGDGRTNAQELADGTHPRGFVTRLFAEGASNGFFRTRFDLANPSVFTGLVRARFLGDAGATLAADVVVPPRGHLALDPSTLPGFSAGSYSAILESDETIAVDRTMTWGAGYGSHLETALRAPSATWYFAEGSTSGEFALFYLLQNPQTTTVSATVRYLRPFGLPPIERTYTLPPASRTTIVVDEAAPELLSTDVSAVITSTAPIVAERAMYLSRAGQPFRAGHESAGVTAPSLDWFLAEGATGGFFDLFVLIANPSPTPANIDVEYLRTSGVPLTKSYVVPAQSRVTIWVDMEELPAGSGQRPLADGSVSTAVHVTNGVPVIVERTMWWPGPAITNDFWYETHNSPGATGTALQWAIGGAEIAGPDETDTYVLIANTADRPGRARIQTLSDGPAGFGEVTLPPKSRTTVSLRSAMPSHAAGVYGVLIESVAPFFVSPVPVPIVVERATYASPGGVFWESGGNALATPLP